MHRYIFGDNDRTTMLGIWISIVFPKFPHTDQLELELYKTKEDNFRVILIFNLYLNKNKFSF